MYVQGTWHVDNDQIAPIIHLFLVCFLFLWPILTYKHRQPRRRQAYPYAPNAAPSANLARLVVAPVAVLGSVTAEVVATRNFVTRGTRVFWPAKDGHSGRTQLGPATQMVFSSETFPLELAWETPKKSSRPPKRIHSRQPTPHPQ